MTALSDHGTTAPDEDGDEPDGVAKSLRPHDIKLGNALVDDEIRALFAQRDRGTRLPLISDSCHSGTVTCAAPVAPVRLVAAPVLRKVPTPNERVTGRGAMLLRTHSKLFPPQIGAHAGGAAVRLHGMGGRGKTEVAAKHAHDFALAFFGRGLLARFRRRRSQLAASQAEAVASV